MNPNRLIRPVYALYIFALCLAFSAHATITGQWNFKNGYNATIGQPISASDPSSQSGTVFGTTASFGISPIAGKVTNVMFFPADTTRSYGEYFVPVGAAANEGGGNVNQYTVIMDVLYTNLPAPGASFAVFSTDTGSGTGSECSISSGGSLNFAGAGGGKLTTNVWHRIAIAVDATNGSSGIAIYIDGTNVATQGAVGGLDGPLSISSQLYMFDDLNTNSGPGFIASLQFDDVQLSSGFIGALGTPTATGILTGPVPNPYIVSAVPVNDLQFPGRSTVPPAPLIQVVINDGATAQVKTNSIVLKFDGSNVTPVITYTAPTTTVSYQVPALLPALSLNLVSLSYQDTASNALGVQYGFDVGPYTALPSTAVGAPGSASVPGFIYRVAQAPSTASLANSFIQAQQQLDGTLLNAAGVAYTNEANLSGSGFQTNDTFFIDQYEGSSGVIAFSTAGAINVLPTFSTLPFPGIPGFDTNGNANLNNFADDTLAYLPLNAGTYTFGVAVGASRVDVPPDNGFELVCGANPRDFFSTVIGSYQRTAANFTVGGNTNTFTFVAPVTGVYPFRLVHWQTTSPQADLAWYYVDPATGNDILINDPAGTIQAFRSSTIKREPYVAEVSPLPGGAGFPSSAPIVVVLGDDDLQVASSSIQLFLNGTKVTPTISKSNSLTTVSYTPNALRTTVTNNVQLVYSDNATTNAHSFTNNWAFTIVVAGATVPPVTGQWDFKGNIKATVGTDLQYFDGTNGQTAQTVQFGTCSSFGIPLINGQDAQVMYRPGFPDNSAILSHYGLTMTPNISPNGGGLKVNQYTIIYDMYYTSATLTFFNCQNTNMPEGTDGSLFLQNGTMGQGSGGYTMNHGAITPGWHRLAFAVDLSQNLITKWVDGVKAQDWVSSANGLDAARRSWQNTVILFGDNDGGTTGDDNTANVYISSIQVRSGKLGDAQMVLLGGASASKIPQTIPSTSVTGQWDFNYSNITATVGTDLQYFDGTNGQTAQTLVFGTCSSFSIPSINGVNANVMYRPGFAGNNPILSHYGLTMTPNISPNGGGLKVNQYTIIYDMYYQGGTLTFFNCQNTNMPEGTDGSLFLQGGAMGQGSGGYTMNNGNIPTGWHRLAFAADLSQNLITKWVDGVKAQDWVSSANGLDAPRRALQNTVILFGDNDGGTTGDDNDANVYIKSIQISAGKLSDAQMMALGGPDGYGIPLAVPSITGTVSGNNVILSWSGAFQGFTLYSTTNLINPAWTPVSGVDYTNNTVTLPRGTVTGGVFFELKGNNSNPATAEGVGNQP
jgi:hypothetical protein